MSPAPSERSGPRPSLAEHAHDELQRRIVEGRVREGERIVIDGVAREFGISVIPVREALARLHAERLVRFEANKGYRVAPAPDPSELRELFEARAVLELGALERGIRNATPAVVEALTGINRAIAAGSYGRSYGSFREFVALNRRFHETLVALPGNRFIVDAYARLGYHQRIALATQGRGIGDQAAIVAEHARIIDALERRAIDEARAALSQHITRGLTGLGIEPAA